jgi:Transposase DDE domain group 1
VFWLTHGVRAAIPQTSPLASAGFATIRDRLLKIGARVIEHIASTRVQLPTSCREEALFRAVALGLCPTVTSSPRSHASSAGASPQILTIFGSRNCARSVAK